MKKYQKGMSFSEGKILRQLIDSDNLLYNEYNRNVCYNKDTKYEVLATHIWECYQSNT